MEIHELNTKALTDPAYVALDDGTDTYKLDFNGLYTPLKNRVTAAEETISELGESPVICYGVCSSPAANNGKVITSDDFTGNGNDYIVIKFTNGNTASQFRMNIDEMGLMYTKFNGSNSAPVIDAGAVLLFRIVDTQNPNNLDEREYHFVGYYPKSKFEEIDEELSELNSDFKYVDGQLADNIGSVYGYLEQGSVNINTGAISDNSNYIRTSDITVLPSTDYTINANNSGSARLSCVAVYYKSDGTYLSNYTIGWINVGDNTYTFTTPSNAYHMRLRFSYYPVASLTTSVVALGIKKGSSWKDSVNNELNSLSSRITTLKTNTIFSYATITTAGLDLNNGDFIHPGTWAVNDAQYLPFHSPTTKRCRIIAFASASDNTIYTHQIVLDTDGKIYKRFSTNTSVWTAWCCENPGVTLSYKPAGPLESFEMTKHTSDDTSDYTIIWGSFTNRCAQLIGMYDAIENPNSFAIDKSSLGKDATNTYDVFLYKVSLGYTNQTNKPIVLIIVGEHGNEPASAMTGYYAYKEIINGSLSKYLKYVDFWIVPIMNPYGYENNIRNNGNDVNLNRDFPANWNYSTDSHNKTANYSMSQPETNYIINLCMSNKNRLLFVVNKHDTGSIGRKIYRNEVDTVGYLTTCLYTDSYINEGICIAEDQQVKETDPYIISACSVDLSHKQLIVNNSPHPLDGSLDLFLNVMGIHASLLEGSYGFNTEESSVDYYDPNEYTNANYATSQIRYITDFLVNYIAWTINNSIYLQTSDMIYGVYPLKSRKYNGSTSQWDDIELWYNGSTFVEITN